MSTAARTVLLTGAAGQVGQALEPRFAAAGWRVRSTDLPELDITDAAAVEAAIAGLRPDAVVNLAAETDADRCEREPERAAEVNAEGPAHLARSCAAHGALLCQISSDYVFSGERRTPYQEDDPTGPLSVYGVTKVAAEEAALVDGLVVRTAWLSGRHGTNIAKTALHLALDPARTLSFVDDQRGSPTVAEDLADALVALVDQGARGRFHVTNAGDATWCELVAHVLECGGHDPERVRPIATDQLSPPRDAPRPSYSVLDGSGLAAIGIGPLRPWQEAFELLVADLVAPRSAAATHA
jgi:dTDP-4-dehydrorhamnose reductase/4-ketoreductase